MLFPVLPIKIGDFYRSWLSVQTVYINVYSIRVRPGRIEGLDAANLAKGVLGHTRIKGIGG